MFDFKKLKVYKKAKTFYHDANELVGQKKFNGTAKDQLTRASFSVILNIAEGSGGFGKPDRRNFFAISRGSIFECVAILDVMHDESLISEEEFNNLEKQADELSRMLYAMIKNLSEA
jgi:four helix bundle protein